MNISGYISKRIAFGKKNSFSATIVRVAIAAVALSVAVMVIGLSLIKGFQQGVKNKFYDNWGHIHITPYLSDPNHYLQEEKVPFDQSLFTQLENYKNVKTVHPFALQSVLLKSKQEMEGIVLKTIFEKHQALINLIEGNQINFSDSNYSKDILISKSLANKLQVNVGETIRLYFILPRNQTPTPRKGIVAGIFDTGLQEFDNQIGYCDHRLIKNVTKDSINLIQGYEIVLDNTQNIQAARDGIYQDLIDAPLYAYTIRERFENIFSWLGMMKTNERLIISIMIIVAIMNMLSTMLILILERTQMIGILKSLGMPNGKMSRIFYISGLRIIVWGLIIGNLIGLVFIFLQRQIGFIKLDPEVYYVSTAPAIYAWPSFVFINALVVAVMLIILLIPTLLIRTIKPVKALQFN